jgi:GT2 family glycosyltransferase
LTERINISNLSSLIRVLKVDKPIGTSKAFQQSFNEVNNKSTHILILDDDNVLNGSLNSIKHFLDASTIINLLRCEREPYCRFYNLGKNIKILKNSFYGFSLIDYINNMLFLKYNKINKKPLNDIKSNFIESDFLPFGGTIFPIALLGKISLNKDFILYHDDIDFFYRSKKIGYKLLITSQCKTIDIDNSWHVMSSSLLESIKNNPKNVYYAIRNKIFFEKKNSSFYFYFYLNMYLWRFVFFVKNYKKANTQEYSLLNKAIEDGLHGKLGVFEK